MGSEIDCSIDRNVALVIIGMKRNWGQRVWVGSRARGHALVFIWESGVLTHTRVIALIAPPKTRGLQTPHLLDQNFGARLRLLQQI